MSSRANTITIQQEAWIVIKVGKLGSISLVSRQFATNFSVKQNLPSC